MTGKRIGEFSISLKTIEDNPEAAKKIMGKVIVIDAKILYGGIVKYKAISDLFEEMALGDKVPEYEIIVTDKGRMKFKKVSYHISSEYAKRIV